MTSLFQVLAADDSEHRLAAHKAVVLSKTRVENEYGKFIAAHGESALDYLETEIAASVHIACAEVGHKDPQGTLEVILAAYKTKPEAESRTAAIHESRKPKMCPFHKDVVDISLAQGDPKAGFESLRDHWGGDRHCEGGGYEGDKCKFKPQMTTQAFWDTKAEKAEQKRQERNDAAELEATQPEQSESVTEPVAEESPTEVIEESPVTVDEPIVDSADDNVVHVDFGSADVEAPAEGTEVPLSMAASFKTSDAEPQHHAEGVVPGPLGIHAGTLKWLGFLDAKVNGESVRQNAPKLFHDHGRSDSPNFRAPVTVSVHHPEHMHGAIEAIETSAQGSTPPPKLKEAASRMAAGELPCPPGVAPHQIKMGSTKTADSATAEKSTPSPKMDKRKWTPKTVPMIEGVDDKDGPHPTRRKDIIDPIIPEDFAELSEVGEQVTEHQDVTQDSKDIVGDPTGVWSGGGHSAVSSHDPHKNELVEIMKSNFDGLLPQSEIDRAVVAHRNS